MSVNRPNIHQSFNQGLWQSFKSGRFLHHNPISTITNPTQFFDRAALHLLILSIYSVALLIIGNPYAALMLAGGIIVLYIAQRNMYKNYQERVELYDKHQVDGVELASILPTIFNVKDHSQAKP
jgi:hypothetical protein